jgi:coatomer subunit beta
MTSLVERSCTLLVSYEKSSQTIVTDVKQLLEEGDVEDKIDGMKKTIALMLNGEPLPGMFISIVRYVLPSEDKTVQKLLMLYMEIIEKADASGSILPEMILICQNLRNNLQSPNEYLRGCTLRFICRLTEAELLEPLVPSIISNLEHRHSFVRRNAALAIKSIYGLPQGEVLLADAPEVMEKFLEGESDLSARRNAFLMLVEHARERALGYLMSQLDQLATWGDVLQVVALELVRKTCRAEPQNKGKLIKIILALLASGSHSVVYECANVLVQLSTAPTAVRAAANAYCQVLATSTDNNVKLVVLDRIEDLASSQREIMQELVMDILRALSSPNLDIRRKALDIALDLTTAKSIDEVVLTLKKEVVKTQGAEKDDKSGDYRSLLVQAIHTAAVRFSAVAGSVVDVLMDFVGDSNASSALDVVHFLREMAETNAELRPQIVTQLLDCFYQVRSSRVCTCALWIIGEYCEGDEAVLAGLATIKQSLGETPFFTAGEDEKGEEDGGEEAAEASSPAPATSSRPVVLADGSYATQTAAAQEYAASGGAPDLGGAGAPQLRSMLLGGDFFVGSVAATALTKLALRLKAGGCAPTVANAEHAQVMLYLVCMLRLGGSPGLAQPMDPDSANRIGLCLRVLSDPSGAMGAVWLGECRAAFAAMIAEKKKAEAVEEAAKVTAGGTQPDELIDFVQLKSRRGMSQVEIEDAVASDLQRATGMLESRAERPRLERVLQLTGMSDPVYAEAYISVHQYDVLLDVTVVNRSEETMQNLVLELATVGDLKLAERPQNHTLAPMDSVQIKANIKVTSTETGVIFGNIVYDAGLERKVVVLADVHLDVIDWISPATTADVSFRAMWAEFEWENKVAVNTALTDVREYLRLICASTNMRCLTPESQLEGEAGFLAANLYARSVFGEDALVNLSVEKDKGGKLNGFVRIRSKTQGIALSLGDKITLRQSGHRAAGGK